MLHKLFSFARDFTRAGELELFTSQGIAWADGSFAYRFCDVGVDVGQLPLRA